MAQATLFRSKSALSDEQIQRYAPSVFAQQAHGSRSDRYAYIPTVDVLNGLRAEGFMPFAVGQTKVRDESKRDYTKHMLRFRRAEHATLVAGTEIPELVLVNSHDGASAYDLTAGFYRVICSNGLVVGNDQFGVRVRHSGNVVDNVIEGSFRVIDGIQQLEGAIDQWKSTTLTAGEQQAFATAALGLRWDADAAPVSATQLLDTRRYEDRKGDLWTTYNKIQENIIRGGLSGRGTTGKRTTTREVASVTENIRLNKALWTLTEELAKLKAA